MIDILGLDVSLNWLDPADRGHPLNRGRVAWWLARPEGMGGPTWRDLVGIYPGAITNAAWQPTTRPGGQGQLVFDESTTYVRGAVPTGIMPPLAIAAWFAPDPTNSTNAGTIVDICQYGVGSNHIRAYTINGGITLNTLNSTGGQDNVASGAVANGSWHRLLISADAAGVVTLYLDGVSCGSTPAVTFGSFDALTSGTLPYGGGNIQFYRGAVDDVALWGRAISIAEVKADFEEGRRGYPTTLDRVGPSVFLMRSAAVVAASFAATLGAVTMIGSASTTVPSTSASLVATLAGVNLAASATAVVPGTNAAFAATLGNVGLAASAGTARAASFAATLAPVTMIGSASTSFPAVHADLAISLAGATLAASATATAPAGIHAALATTLEGVTVGGSATAGSAAGTATFAANLAGVSLTAAAGATIPPSAAGFAASLAGVSLGATATWVSPGIHMALTAPLAGVTLGATAAHVGLPAVAAFGATLGGVAFGAAAYHVGPAYRPTFAATLDGVLLGASAVSTGQAYAYFAAALGGVSMVTTARAVPMLRSMHFAGALDGVELAAGVLVPYTVRRAPDPRMATSRRLGPDPNTATWTRGG